VYAVTRTHDELAVLLNALGEYSASLMRRMDDLRDSTRDTVACNYNHTVVMTKLHYIDELERYKQQLDVNLEQLNSEQDQLACFCNLLEESELARLPLEPARDWHAYIVIAQRTLCHLVEAAPRMKPYVVPESEEERVRDEAKLTHFVDNCMVQRAQALPPLKVH
jgi:hypothetical protein